MSRLKTRLAALRAERHLSQRQLAAMAGVRPDTVSALERGASKGIQFATLDRLCGVLECQPGDLLQIERESHRVPVLGRDNEDDIVRQRLSTPGRAVDGPSFVAELLKDTAKPRPKTTPSN